MIADQQFNRRFLKMDQCQQNMIAILGYPTYPKKRRRMTRLSPAKARRRFRYWASQMHRWLNKLV